jgi:regulator of replication initiation timing
MALSNRGLSTWRTKILGRNDGDTSNVSVGVDERNALLKVPASSVETSDGAGQNCMSSERLQPHATQELMTCLGHISLTLEAAEQSENVDWCNDLMEYVRHGYKIARRNGWDQIAKAFSDVARIFISYEEAQYAGLAQPFLRRSYKLLIDMANDLLRAQSRPIVAIRWTEHMEEALNELQARNIPIIPEGEDAPRSVSFSGAAVSVAGDTPRDTASIFDTASAEPEAAYEALPRIPEVMEVTEAATEAPAGLPIGEEEPVTNALVSSDAPLAHMSTPPTVSESCEVPPSPPSNPTLTLAARRLGNEMPLFDGIEDDTEPSKVTDSQDEKGTPDRVNNTAETKYESGRNFSEKKASATAPTTPPLTFSDVSEQSSSAVSAKNPIAPKETVAHDDVTLEAEVEEYPLLLADAVRRGDHREVMSITSRMMLLAAQTEIRQYQRRVDETQNTIRDFEEAIAEAEQRIAKLRETATTLVEEESALETRLSEVEDEEKRLTEEGANLQQQIEELRARLRRLEQEFEAKQQDLEKLSAEEQRIRMEQERLRTEHDRTLSAERLADKERRRLREECDAHRETAATLKQILAERESAYQSLREVVVAAYGLPVEINNGGLPSNGCIQSEA